MRYWLFSFSAFIILVCGILIGLIIKFDNCLPDFLVVVLWMISCPSALVSSVIAYYSGTAILEERRKKK